MRIALYSAGPRPTTPLIAFGVLVMTGIYLFVTTALILPALVCLALATVILLSFGPTKKTKPYLVIDDSGIYDARIGIPKIPWRDISQVSIVSGYGNRFLCIRVEDPQAYLAILSGRSKERLQFNQKLGFRSFNIDVGDLNINLLDLKKLVETRAKRSRSNIADRFRMRL
jgi:hypothetical protein